MACSSEMLSEKNFKNGLLGFIFEFVDAFVFALVFTVIVNSFVFRLFTVSGSSMTYTLSDGDKLILSNAFYEPAVGDIVALKTFDMKFKASNNPPSIIKRVIAKEGQTVDISDDGFVYVDGVKLNEPYIHAKTSKGSIGYPFTVPPGEIFCMGDNRRGSFDSRYCWSFSVCRVMGRVIFRPFPLKSFGFVS